MNGPALAALVAGVGRAAILTQDGELLDLSAEFALGRLRHEPPPLLVHAPATARRLGAHHLPAFDLLELFAFVHPARPATPTPRGLALALDLPPPSNRADAAALLPELASVLLGRLRQMASLPTAREMATLAARMGQAGWPWARAVMAALDQAAATPAIGPFKVWQRLPEWQEQPPPPPPAATGVSGAEARTRLAALLGPGAEQRPGQADYAAAVAVAFTPREVRGEPTVVLAEAGTGTGKTLAYVAPASVWAERNRSTVWVSTYTRHLQRQIDAELVRLVPDATERRRRVVVRKGRENYLCLLNYEDAVNVVASGGAYAAVVPLGLIARWATATVDGDVSGGDLPGWFSELFGTSVTIGLADRRGECIHSACPHWRRCFVEHTVRRARDAELVVANHALVMSQVGQAYTDHDGIDGMKAPTRYVFDEGHHLFDAADNAFSVELSGIETAELRRWLLGAEGSNSRAKGIRRRLEDLVAGRPELGAPLDAMLQAARALPAPGWSMRLSEDTSEAGLLENPTEAVLRALRGQVLARLPGDAAPGPGSHETDLHPVGPDLPEAAATLSRAYARLEQPVRTLAERLLKRLDDEAEEMDADLRDRIEAVARSLRRRVLDRVVAWQAMLDSVGVPPPEPGVRPAHVEFLRLDRREAGDRDVALLRHWLDPTIPFVATLARPAHGVLVTSATLRDPGESPEAAWAGAEARVGATHLATPAIRVAVASPFDYPAQTRCYVATDVTSYDIPALAAAYRALFVASGGGALGLFTAISRLRAVHAKIAGPLEAAGIALLAQHVDAMDNATLVDVFRTETESCLLGTDAMRDGVDVPGRALRLVVFERVPWARRDILHRERRVHLSGGDPKAYDDRIARLRLRQGFGRLIRASGDRGAFVLLDRQTPTRLLNAFPPGVEVIRTGLAEIVADVRGFLA